MTLGRRQSSLSRVAQIFRIRNFRWNFALAQIAVAFVVIVHRISGCFGIGHEFVKVLSPGWSGSLVSVAHWRGSIPRELRISSSGKG